MAKTYILDYRNIQTRGFWSDPFVMKLPLREKLFYIYILTNPRITYCGIFEFSIEESALYLKIPEKEVTALVEKFASEYKKIAWSKDTEEIAIVNWMKHNTFSERQEMGFQNALKAVKNKDLNAYVMGLDTHTNGIANPSTYILFNTSPSLLHSPSLDSFLPVLETKDEIQILFDDYANGDTEVLEALNDFKSMRKQIKEPLTLRATEIMLKQLDKLSQGERQMKIDILHQSIMNNWRGIFAIKSQGSMPNRRETSDQEIARRTAEIERGYR